MREKDDVRERDKDQLFDERALQGVRRAIDQLRAVLDQMRTANAALAVERDRAIALQLASDDQRDEAEKARWQAVSEREEAERARE